ncbi:MAG: M3 family metallopeptidase [Tatlockia sp.]|nr:M3 family metallopeptidase [Tatlockia sp.]
MSEENLPKFTTIDTNSFVEELDKLLQGNLQQITHILAENRQFTWENLMMPMEDMDDALERFWSPLSHLHAVVNSQNLRSCYEACLPKLSVYEATMGHNQKLYNAVKSLDKTKLNTTQCKIVEDLIRDFELSGVALSEEDKKRFETIQTELSNLANQFENNILDAGEAFSIHIKDEKRLAGLPEHALNRAQELAVEKGVEGWLLNLEFPCYLAVISYAEDRALRKEIYDAFVTRASDQGPSAGQFDNSNHIDEILALRQEKAELLGFSNYAELSLATKMAESADQVLNFISKLAKRGHRQAEDEFKALAEFAAKDYGITELKPWDLPFISEKESQARYAISQEELRPYFSLNKVMTGLFSIVNKLYGMSMEEVEGVNSWHPEVKCYRVLDETKQLRGHVYVDLFARPHKRNGAWMDSLQSRRKLAKDGVQLPIATLTCNFAKPSANKMAALSHDEVLTLFHEFGHCLQHVLTKVDYLNVSGINGVEWDAVELPSQFFENWCWEQSALELLTEHVDSGEALPEELFKKVLAAKNFQSALALMRQLEFSLFDFRIHQEFKPGQVGLVAKILAEVRKQTTIVPIVPYNRFQNSFSHIFAGGYAAGYYSYKWAEVLSADAFSRFEEEGVFNEQAGRDFLHSILEVGGSRKAAEAYLKFRGRAATVDALLRHSGIH